MTPENADEMLATTKTLVLDFGATCCGPCKRIGPIVEKFAADHADKVDAGYVDVGAHPALAQRFGVMGVPTVIIFKAGKEEKRFGANLNLQMLEAVLS
jgi:thioredoxin 1